MYDRSEKDPMMKNNIRHIVSVSGGKDSTATLIHAMNRVPHEQIIPIFCDTGNEHAITYQYLDDLERHIGFPIVRLKADFSAEIAAKRRFVARDCRTRREYQTAPVFDHAGNPVPKRDGRGNIIMRLDRKSGEMVPVQKTRKVGGGRKARWSNKAKRRALAVLHPSGNPFLDMCLWKGRFPSTIARFCTEELKRNLLVNFQLGLQDQGFSVLSWQGIRRDESANRRNAKRVERVGRGMWIFRPIVDWTAQQTVDFVRASGFPLNPLYSQGCNRVGCMPCIHVKKSELSEISWRFPEEIDRIEQWEILVCQASKHGFSTMIGDSHVGLDRRQVFSELNIREQVRWATNTRVGGNLSLFGPDEFNTSCSSAYGLCE
jgi:3'-phosphoadenosine 5'-phosphosulfate sulfotransferase (PAPS reductase)/FAD synthetase